MYVVCVEVRVEPHAVEAFIAATRRNHEATRRDEPNNVRFDLLQAEGDPTRFFIYEVYRARQDFDHHHATEHYRRWRAEVDGLMAEPRKGSRYLSLCPADAGFGPSA